MQNVYYYHFWKKLFNRRSNFLKKIARNRENKYENNTVLVD